MEKPDGKGSVRPFLTEYQDPASEREMPLGRVLLDLFVKLGFVLAIAYCSIYALRGFLARQGTLPGRRGHLRVLESASLGPNRSVHLVRVGGKVMVVGSTPEQVTALTEIDDPDVLAQLNDESPSRFSNHLETAMTGSGGITPDQAPKAEGGQPLTAEMRGGVRHLWNQVQEIRGLQPRKGSDR